MTDNKGKSKSVLRPVPNLLYLDSSRNASHRRKTQSVPTHVKNITAKVQESHDESHVRATPTSVSQDGRSNSAYWVTSRMPFNGRTTVVAEPAIGHTFVPHAGAPAADHKGNLPMIRF